MEEYFSCHQEAPAEWKYQQIKENPKYGLKVKLFNWWLFSKTKYIVALLIYSLTVQEMTGWSNSLSSSTSTLSQLCFLSECVCVLVIQFYPALCHPMDCNLPSSSVHGILQIRILQWVAISSSRGSSGPKDWTGVSCIAGRFLYKDFQPPMLFVRIKEF